MTRKSAQINDQSFSFVQDSPKHSKKKNKEKESDKDAQDFFELKKEDFIPKQRANSRPSDQRSRSRNNDDRVVRKDIERDREEKNDRIKEKEKHIQSHKEITKVEPKKEEKRIPSYLAKRRQIPNEIIEEIGGYGRINEEKYGRNRYL